MSDDRKWARLLRLGIVGAAYRNDELTREDAIECLNRNLNPNDDSTFVDDSRLLDMTFQEAVSSINAEEAE